MPDALRRDLGDEHEPAVGELGLAVRAVGLDDQLADELAMDVGRPQLARRAEPARVDLAAADEPAGLDVEDVGEVGLDLDLDRQADRPPPVVDDVVVLVDAARDRPVDAQTRGCVRGTTPSRSSSSGFVYSKRDE